MEAPKEMLPIRINLDDLKKDMYSRVTGPLVKYENCTFKSAHFNPGLISENLSLNSVSISNPLRKENKKESSIIVHSVTLEVTTSFISLVHNPEVNGTIVTLFLERLIKMKIIPSSRTSSGQPMTLPPSLISAEGVIIYFQFEEDLQEWEQSINNKREELTEYDIREKFLNPSSIRPRAPV